MIKWSSWRSSDIMSGLRHEDAEDIAELGLAVARIGYRGFRLNHLLRSLRIRVENSLSDSRRHLEQIVEYSEISEPHL